MIWNKLLLAKRRCWFPLKTIREKEKSPKKKYPSSFGNMWFLVGAPHLQKKKKTNKKKNQYQLLQFIYCNIDAKILIYEYRIFMMY